MVFVIDATGSMSDEIDVVKKQLIGIAERLASSSPTPDIRFGMVAYRDLSDDDLIEMHPLTRDVQSVHQSIMMLQASGGGDWEEHVGRGLHEALAMGWDDADRTTRLIYLVGDAPAHTDYQDEYSLEKALGLAVEKGVLVNVIACSGIDSGRGQFERIAQRTDGVFESLTYHAVVKDEATGQERSVIYADGEYYEADEVLDEQEWKKGADTLAKGKKVRKSADTKLKRSMSSAKVDNNLDGMLEESIKTNF